MKRRKEGESKENNGRKMEEKDKNECTELVEREETYSPILTKFT